jgi:hypothetical protein
MKNLKKFNFTFLFKITFFYVLFVNKVSIILQNAVADKGTRVCTSPPPFLV